MQEAATGSLVEGIGDEALIVLFTALTVVMLSLLACAWATISAPRAGSQPVHPLEVPYLEEERQRHQQDESRLHRMQSSGGEVSPCPICMCDMEIKVETNCGHWFCGPCMAGYWRHRSPVTLQPVPCPCCRQPVNVLFLELTAEEEARRGAPEADGVRIRECCAEIAAYNHYCAQGGRSWGSIVRDAPVLVRRLITSLFTNDGLRAILQARWLILFVVSLLYAVCPFDFLPEAVFGIVGLLDDLLVIIAAVLYASTLYRMAYLRDGGRPHAD